MGLCASKEDAKKATAENQKITKLLDKDKRDDKRMVKLLLLGTGESGKSTIFKQMQILYQDGFTDADRSTYKHVVRRNVIESIQTLVQGAVRFGFKLEGPEVEEAAKIVLDLDPLDPNFWIPNIARYVTVLWKCDAIKRAYENRSKLQLPDSAEYLLQRVDVYADDGFVPNQTDILMARLRTSGIVEKVFKINGVDFKFIDVGGQRNERRKWMHCFDEVTAVLFVAALSEYDQTLYEDEKENRLQEAITVFESVANSKFFENTAMIVFLNKVDLFEEKIRRVPIKTFFPDYSGPNEREMSIAYIRDLFKAQRHNPSNIYFHVTCATDTGNVQKVFTDCKSVILKKNLEKLGLA